MDKQIKVLIVDDSFFMRYKIRNILTEDERFLVVGEAGDGIEALELLHKLEPDVVTLDVEMPVMGGLETLKRIIAEKPVPVVMISVLTTPGAQATLESLRLGAVDFIAKDTALNNKLFKDLLTSKLYAASLVDTDILCRRLPKEELLEVPLRPVVTEVCMVVIGSSTGGPRALYHLVPQLPEDIPASIFIVQHMPVGFTKHLAIRLNEQSRIKVKEAEQGEHIERGVAYIAPAGCHMVTGKGVIRLTKDPPVNNVRPSVDVTMKSLAKQYGERVIGIILTGMGKDGTLGACEINKAGGIVIAEAESSCVVYGMPKSVIEGGHCNLALPLEEIGKELIHVICRPGFDNLRRN